MTIFVLNKIHKIKRTFLIEVVKSYQADGNQIISRNKYKYKTKQRCLDDLPMIHRFEKGLEYNIIDAEIHIDETGREMGYHAKHLWNLRADEIES